ncbi:MAG: hypothetical protein RLZZ516_2614 [Cyanobacteriota bacterium]
MAAALLTLPLLALSLGVLPLPLPLQIAGMLGLGGGGVLVLRHRRWSRRRQGALLLTLIVVWAWGFQGRPAPGPDDPSRLISNANTPLPVELRGRLLSDPQPLGNGAGCRVPLQLNGGRTEGLFERCPALQQGWRLEATGVLVRPQPAPHPLLSGSAERLARQGIWSQLRIQQWRVLQRTATPIADLRRRMALALVHSGGAEAGGVLAALVLGSAVVPVPLAVREAFRAAGLSHALAASGFHLTVLLGAVMAFSRFGGRAWRWGLALGAMALFLLLAGPQPSVVRAVAMGAMVFLVQESGRRVRPLGVLLLCVLLILLAAPSWLLDVGFQLSVAATAGLLLSAGPLEESLRGRLPSGRWASWAAPAIAVPLAASLWTLPLQLLHFGALPLYAVPANMLVAPLLTPLTLGAMAMAVAALVLPPLVGLLGWLLVPLTQLFVAVARLMAGLPMAQWQLGQMNPWLVLLLSLALLPLLCPLVDLAAGHRRWLRCGGAGLLALVVILHGAQLWRDQLLLVQDGGRDLLVARHAGRGVLISRRSDSLSCSRASRLALALGVQRYDWVLSLDPIVAEQPACWQRLTPTLLAPEASTPALAAGQRLTSPGLSVSALAADSEALLLEAGNLRWGLLPDRQAWWSWQRLRQGTASRSGGGDDLDGLWLGFRPTARERRQLPAGLSAERLWSPPAGSGSGWRLA